MDKDSFIGFISQIANKIKIEQDHKRIINDLNNKPVDIEKASLKNVILTIKEKISENSGIKEVKPEVKIFTEEQLATSPIVTVISEEENNFEDFVSRLKNILNKPSDEKEKIEKKPILEELVVDTSVENRVEPEKEIIPDIEDEKEDISTNNYLDVLNRLQDKIAVEKEDVKVTEIKKLIEEYAEKYVKRVVGIAGESGGGTNAVQYANGGTMNGDLNVTGNYLSAGINLLNVFTGGGGGSGDPEVNTLVHSNSGYWNTAYTNLATNSGAYLSGVDISLIATTSASWNSVYTTVNTGSASNLIDGGNIRGANIAVGTRDGYHVALRSNNANRVWILSSGEVGIGPSLSNLINLVNSSSPNSPRLTVSGILSSNNTIYAAGGDSNSWNSVYTTTNTNSASWTAGSSQIRTPGVASIGVGKDALVNPSASFGQYNTALGNNALSTCSTGTGNTAVGSGSLPSLTNGSLNTALGYNTLLKCVTGTGNIAIGANALTNSNGYNNVAIGVDTLLSAPAAGILFGDNTAVGNGALSSVSGGSNIALGFRAGETLPAGNSNIFIGVVATTTLPMTGSIAIGRNASPTRSNQLVLGSPSYPLNGNSILYGNLAVTSTTNALSTTGGTSDNWNSTYTTVSANSAYWADTRNNVTFSGTVSAGSNILSNQVAFSVNNASVPAGFGAGATITYNVTNVNRGNALNTSTGIFTAPVSGVYFVTFSGITESTGPHEVVLYKNNSFFPGIRSYNQDNGFNSINFSLAMTLNATDTLKIVVLTGKIHGNNGSCFSGYLIG